MCGVEIENEFQFIMSSASGVNKKMKIVIKKQVGDLSVAK
jgi:hypothetical protein